MTDYPRQRRWRRLLIDLGLSALAATAIWYSLISDLGPSPVRDTTLQEIGWRTRFGGPNWRKLPFALDPAEEAVVGEANAIAGRANSTHNDGVVLDRDETRADLKALLTR